MRRRASLLISIPVAVAGSLLAHQISYALQATNGVARARLLAATGHGYIPTFPLLAGVLLAVVIGGLIREGVLRWRGEGRTGLLWPIALISPLAFVVQEHLERLLHDGVFPWHLATQPAFLRGLALQIPFALLALGLATIVAGSVRQAVDVFRGGRRVASPARPIRRLRPTAGGLKLRLFLGSSEARRAPPMPVR